MRGGVGDNPASHAVTGEDHSLSVDAECGGVGAKISEHGVRVFEVLGEAEVAGAAPRSAVVERHGIPSGASQGLR